MSRVCYRDKLKRARARAANRLRDELLLLLLILLVIRVERVGERFVRSHDPPIILYRSLGLLSPAPDELSMTYGG